MVAVESNVIDFGPATKLLIAKDVICIQLISPNVKYKKGNPLQMTFDCLHIDCYLMDILLLHLVEMQRHEIH